MEIVEPKYSIASKDNISGYLTRVEGIAALCGIIWFVCIIDACFTWLSPWSVRYMIGASSVFYATFLLKQNDALEITPQRKHLLLMVFLLLFLQITLKSKFFIAPFVFLPFMCLTLWNSQTLMKMYIFFRRFVIFYSIVSIVVELLVLSGLWTSLPCIDLPPQDTVQEDSETINHFYGLFVIPEDGLTMLPLSFYRAMGPLREGGHFSIFIGFTYFVEMAVYNKRNIWLLICGFLTLSPNFVFFFLVTEVYCAILKRQIFKFILQISLFLVLLVFAVLFSPSFIQEEIVRIVLERSLEENLASAESDGFMALLEGRTNLIGSQMYANFAKRADMLTKLLGSSELKEGYVLSDFRYLIYYYGYVGFLLYVVCSAKIAFMSVKFFYGLCLLVFALFVMLSRAWMFDQVYIWTMMLLAVNALFLSGSANVCGGIEKRIK